MDGRRDAGCSLHPGCILDAECLPAVHLEHVAYVQDWLNSHVDYADNTEFGKDIIESL